MAQDSTATAVNQSTKQALESRALAPRFYTTNCEEIGQYDIEPVRDEWDVMMAAFELDKNREHFKQNYDLLLSSIMLSSGIDRLSVTLAGASACIHASSSHPSAFRSA